MKDFVLQSPTLTLCADSNDVLNYKSDPHNYITQVFGEQLPAIKNGFFNVHMNRGIIINPHWHTNVTEMVFVICGEIVTSVFNPFTQRLMTYKLKPGQVVVLPKGWFHWIVALTDNTHILAIFDQPTPDIVYASDFLRFTPKEIMHQAYCVNAEEFAMAVEPIKESVILGPPVGCCVDGSSKITQTISPIGTWPGQQVSWSQNQVGQMPFSYASDGTVIPQNYGPNNSPNWSYPYSY